MRKTTKTLISVLLAAAMLFGFAACGGQTNTANTAAQNTANTENAAAPEEFKLVSQGMMNLEYAKNFTIELFEGGYRMISAGTGGYKYLVVPEGKPAPKEGDVDEKTYVLQMPINKVYMASTGMESLVDAIDALDCTPLVGTDKSGWYLPNVIAAMESGKIKFGGKYSEPDFEMITKEEIQLHVNTTMIDSKPEVLDKFKELNIPSLVEDSSKEGSPLARVEWVKLFGVLFNKEAEAEKYFEEQKAMVEAAKSDSLGKTVCMGYISSKGDKAYARNGGDYYGQMLVMAGGEYPFGKDSLDKSGNANMTMEAWYDAFKDADYMFYMNFAAKFYTIQEMIDFNPLFADMKAVKNGNVWITSPDFTQSTAAIAGIMKDMHTIFAAEDPSSVTTDHLIKIK